MAVNVGLDIGTSAVRAAVVQTGKGAPVLKRYGEVALPPGAVMNGEIVDEAIVADALSKLWKSAKIPKKRVVVGLASQRVIVRQVTVPAMAPDEFAEALSFQAQEYIPIPVDDAVLDFVPLEEFASPEGEPLMSVLIVAAQKDMATELLGVLGRAGIKPIAFDLQAFALVRALGTGDIDPNARAIVNIGASLTQVIVVRNDAVRFLRIVPMGGEDFTRALVEGLGYDRDTAEQAKRRVGVAPSGSTAEAEDDDEARRLLTVQADALIDEVRSSIDFYLSQGSAGGIDRLLVSGNGARLPHLANRMKTSLDVNLEPIRIITAELVTIDKGARLDDEQQRQVEPVIPISVGLGLWGET